jgi:Skp family chaperone for outer membrane proteins
MTGEESQMSQSLLWMRCLILSCVLLSIVFAVRASATDKGNGALVLATVDYAKIQAEYKLKASMESDIKSLQLHLTNALNRRETMPLLSEAEQLELDKLNEKDATTRTDADKKRMDDLTARGNQLGAEIQALRQKDQKDITEADKKKLKDAEEAFVKAQSAFATKKEESSNKLQQLVQENSDKLLKNVREAIKKVAEQKAVSIVFNSEVAPYAGMDITQPVVSELNKK